MKKIFFSLTFLIGLFLNVEAQEKPISFGLKAGVSFPNMAATMSDLSSRYDGIAGFYVGGNVIIPLGEVFSFQPGLIFIQKGTSVESKYFTVNDPSLFGKPMELGFSYLEMPLNFVADMSLGKKYKLFYGAGPYFAYAMDGRIKIDNYKEKIDFGSGVQDYKRGDIGLNFLFGLDFGTGFQLDAGYGLGFSGVVSSGTNNMPVKIKHRVYRVGMAYSF